jgi:site-specific DNA-methyltransferase (adenine-specific)
MKYFEGSFRIKVEQPIMDNTLYYGDNLAILREHFQNETVDLIYLDPPFNSKQDYNILFKEQGGEPAQAQIKAFTDTWKWSEHTYHEFSTTCTSDPLIQFVKGFVDILGRNDVTAYLVMMAPRLLELYRVLKPTGSLYLHCDPSASHYLKLMLDCIFGPKQFNNEIIWWYSKWSASKNRFLRNHDVIFFYCKSKEHTFTVQYVPLSPSTLKRFGGKRQDFADEDRTRKITTDEDSLGSYMPDVWPISALPAASAERLGYPTQKPLALLDRIILASSKPGDIVLDPFCGCGTAVISAAKHKRKWLGVDITHIAISLIKTRLADTFTPTPKYAEVNIPTTESEAQALAERDRHEFQKWAVSLVPRAYPSQDKKGADQGIDGVVRFQDDSTDPKRCVIQVKSGKVGVSLIRDFRGVMEREKAVLGFFITLETASAPMNIEAASLGFYTTPLGNRAIQRLQIRTVKELLSGNGFDVPFSAQMHGVRQAGSHKPDAGQESITLEFQDTDKNAGGQRVTDSVLLAELNELIQDAEGD